jgi:RNA:NAD 2'-phosphotransferase (TPT1/KptA family)
VLRFDRYDWAFLEAAELKRASLIPNPSRFDVSEGRIRACYGHSVKVNAIGPPQSPPEVLFHELPRDCVGHVAEVVMFR